MSAGKITRLSSATEPTTPAEGEGSKLELLLAQIDESVAVAETMEQFVKRIQPLLKDNRSVSFGEAIKDEDLVAIHQKHLRIVIHSRPQIWASRMK